MEAKRVLVADDNVKTVELVKLACFLNCRLVFSI
jgi:hypothetical protein